MKLKNRYYILRHGQTIYQTKKKDFIYPRFDSSSIKLTKKGEKQIKKGAKPLKKKGIDLIFSSDFFRTRQTAKIITKEVGAKILFDKRLRDINLGIYHGKTKKEFYRDFPKYSKTRFKKGPKNGENWSNVKRRMLNLIRDIEKKHKGKNILIVGHAEPLWLLEGGLKNWSVAEFLRNRKNNYIKVGELREV